MNPPTSPSKVRRWRLRTARTLVVCKRGGCDDLHDCDPPCALVGGSGVYHPQVVDRHGRCLAQEGSFDAIYCSTSASFSEISGKVAPQRSTEVYIARMDPLHATLEELVAEGYTHVSCHCTRFRMTRMRPVTWLPKISMGLTLD
jgi:hypothetical protein